MDIHGKSVLITGANRGIGAALVRAFLGAGAGKVYAAARDPASLPDFADKRVAPLALDITNPSQVADAAKKAGAVDILINNAGVARFGGLFVASPADMAADMEVNYFGNVRMMREFAPAMEKRGGVIANIISVVGLAALVPAAGYSASKAALFSATQAARATLKPKNIKVVGVFPGPIDTDMAANLMTEKATPDHAAEEIVKGLIAGDEDIYPDPMSKKLSALWNSNPKSVERYFAEMAA